MATPTRVRLRTDPAQPVGSTDVAVNWFPDAQTSSVALQASVGWKQIPEQSQAVEDLLGIAVAIYVADKSISREEQADGWTRQFQVEIPVHDPSRWSTSDLQEMLSFLTGDIWALRLRRGSPTPVRGSSDAHSTESQSVAMFSGGLDSLAGALDLTSGGGSAALVSYFGDNPTGSLQRALASDIETGSGVDIASYRFRLVESLGARSLGSQWPGMTDPTTRSRSFLFLALGVLVADSLRAETLLMPENGFIAINVPLHDGRVGSLSTRTAHPHFVSQFNNLLGLSGIGVVVENPFLLITKGEVSQRLIDLGGEALISRTVSCAHPVGRWQREGYRNCGYCYPCLIRRAGLHKAGGDDTEYSIDPFTDETFYSSRPAAASDVRSLARSLVDPTRVGDILAVAPLPSYELVLNLHEMRKRGVEELRAVVDEAATEQVKHILGL